MEFVQSCSNFNKEKKNFFELINKGVNAQSLDIMHYTLNQCNHPCDYKENCREFILSLLEYGDGLAFNDLKFIEKIIEKCTADGNEILVKIGELMEKFKKFVGCKKETQPSEKEEKLMISNELREILTALSLNILTPERSQDSIISVKNLLFHLTEAFSRWEKDTSAFV